MKTDSIIILPEQVHPNKGEVLFEEFKYAWDKTSNVEKWGMFKDW